MDQTFVYLRSLMFDLVYSAQKTQQQSGIERHLVRVVDVQVEQDKGAAVLQDEPEIFGDEATSKRRVSALNQRHHHFVYKSVGVECLLNRTRDLLLSAVIIRTVSPSLSFYEYSHQARKRENKTV